MVLRFPPAPLARRAAVAALCAAGLAACGSSGSSGSSTPAPASSAASGGSASGGSATSASSGGSGALSASKLASLQSMVSQAEKPPTFTAPGAPVKASAVKGKSFVVFPVNSQIDACQTQAEDFSALGQKLGAHVTLVSNSGQPSQWQTAVEDAVGAHDAGVAMLCGVIPGAIGPQLSAAKSAGVSIVDGNYNETSNYTGLDGETAVLTAEGMKLDVADALVNLKGKPLHALVLSSDSIVQGPAAVQAVNQAIQSDCGSSCSVTQTLVVPIQNWATAIQSDVASALVAHPNTNAVIIAFDGMTQFALPAVSSSHTSGLKIYTWGGSRSIEKLMQTSGSPVAADVGINEQEDAYEAMDQLIRLANHSPAAPVSKEIDPNVMFTPANVASFFGPGGSYGNAAWGGDTFIKGFDKLWGVS